MIAMEDGVASDRKLGELPLRFRRREKLFYSITQIPCKRCKRWMAGVTLIGRDGDGEDEEEENRLSVRVKVLVAACEINDANRLSSRVKE